MKWNLDKSRPVCPQLCEQICVQIAVGHIAPGEKLMSVREVAVSAGVNPNTVQKAFEQLEGKGIIFSVRGSGWYVAENSELAKDEVSKIICDKTRDFFCQLVSLGMDNEQIKTYVKEWDE